MNPVRVVLADDSAIARNILHEALAATGIADIQEQCADGLSALRAVARLRPDVLLLDIEMPGMDGMAVLKAVRQQSPSTAVLMCSATTRRGAAVTLQALSAGAADYITKPTGSTGRADAVRSLAAQLGPRLRALGPKSQPAATPSPFHPASAGTAHHQPTTCLPGLVLLGASTGGPAALESFFRALPPGLATPILVLQHMPEMFTEVLAERLSAAGRVQVRVAGNNTPVAPGAALLARGGHNAQIRVHLGTLAVRQRLNPREDLCSPSVDAALISAVECLGPRVTACILSGMGSDGLAGARDVIAAEGTVLAQTQSSSVVWGMPRAVIQAGLASQQLTPQQMAQHLAATAAQESRQSQQQRLIRPLTGTTALVRPATA